MKLSLRLRRNFSPISDALRPRAEQKVASQAALEVFEDRQHAEHADRTFEIVNEHVQAHLRLHVRQALHQAGCRSHPVFDRAVGVFDELFALAHRIGVFFQLRFGRLEPMFIHPPPDAPIGTARTPYTGT